MTKFMKVFSLVTLAGVLTLLSNEAFAYKQLKDVEFILNHDPNAGPVVQLGTLESKKKVNVVRCEYDFAVAGSPASSTYVLRDVDGSPCSIPEKAIVITGVIDVITAVTGPSATLSLGTGKFNGVAGGVTNDIKAAATLLAVNSYSTITLLDVLPQQTAATMIKNTSTLPMSPNLTITGAPLTAGKFEVFIEFYMSK